MGRERCLSHTARLFLRSVPNVLLPRARISQQMRLQECEEIITQLCQKSRPGASSALPSIAKEKQLKRLGKRVDPTSCKTLGLAPAPLIQKSQEQLGVEQAGTGTLVMTEPGA